MKKVLCALLCALLTLCCLPLFSAAAESGLPFDIAAPGNVAVNWENENDSPTTMAFSYTLTNETAQFYKDLDDAIASDTVGQFLSEYDFDEIRTFLQIDWAIDDVNDEISGWHYNEFWNGTENFGPGYDGEGRIRVSEWDGVSIPLNNATETGQSEWIMRSVPDDVRWNGDPETLTPGVKDQLRPGQYTFDHEIDTVRIDFKEHTAYFRARLVTVTCKNTEEGAAYVYHYSDWSATVGYGKGVAKLEPLKPGEIAAPVITGLRKTDKEFNDNPVVAFTLTVPDALQAQLTNVSVLGGSIAIETQARVKGDEEWTEMGNTDWIVKPGEMECALLHLVNAERPTVPADSVIELRCRYRCAQPEKEDFFSDWSKIISFGTDDINAGKGDVTDGTGDPSGEPAPGKEPEEDKCPICGFCPQPLGLCIFIWLAIILAIIVIAVVVIVVVKKNKKKKEK